MECLLLLRGLDEWILTYFQFIMLILYKREIMIINFFSLLVIIGHTFPYY